MLQTNVSQWQVAPSLDWIARFGSWLDSKPTQKHKLRSPLTKDAYLNDVRLLAQYLEQSSGQAFSPEFLRDADLKAYFGQLERVSRPATYNHKLASVRMLIAWARSGGLLDHDPAEWIPVLEMTHKSPSDICAEERLKLEAAAEAGEGTLIGLRDSLLFFLMNDAGLRINETVTLRRSDLHLDKGEIHVWGKGKKHRVVKIGSRLSSKIRAWLDRMPASVEGTLITDESGSSIERGQAWRRFVLIAKKAGVKTTPHAMRHTYIYRYMEAYMQRNAGEWSQLRALKAACQQTGDTEQVILAYYTAPRESDMRMAAEAM